jgi:hypothetical protein
MDYVHAIGRMSEPFGSLDDESSGSLSTPDREEASRRGHNGASSRLPGASAGGRGGATLMTGPHKL